MYEVKTNKNYLKKQSYKYFVKYYFIIFDNKVLCRKKKFFVSDDYLGWLL